MSGREYGKRLVTAGVVLLCLAAPAVASADTKWDTVGGAQLGTAADEQRGGDVAMLDGFAFTVTSEACSCTPGRLIQVWRSDRQMRYWQPVGIFLNNAPTSKGVNPTIKNINGKIYVAWEERGADTGKLVDLMPSKVFAARLDVEDEWTIDPPEFVGGSGSRQGEVNAGDWGGNAAHPTLSEYHGSPVVGYIKNNKYAVVRSLDPKSHNWEPLANPLGILNPDNQRGIEGNALEFKLQNVGDDQLYAAYIGDLTHTINFKQSEALDGRNLVFRKFDGKESWPVMTAATKVHRNFTQPHVRGAADLTTGVVDGKPVAAVSVDGDVAGERVIDVISPGNASPQPQFHGADKWWINRIFAPAGSELTHPAIMAAQNGNDTEVYLAAESATRESGFKKNQLTLFHGSITPSDRSWLPGSGSVVPHLGPVAGPDAVGLADATTGSSNEPRIVDRGDGKPLITFEVTDLGDNVPHVRAVTD